MASTFSAITMRVPDIVQKCVGFLMYRGKRRDGPELAGTAFLVQYPIAVTGKALLYLVTAYHVIAHVIQHSVDGKVWLRANLKDGRIINIETHASDWYRHPTDTSVDVAVLPWQPTLEQGWQLDLVPIGTNDLFGTEENLRAADVGIGDDIFITGLFSRFIGNESNLPIIRMGSIALIPREPVSTKFGDMEAVLVEVRSIGGLSGSPVFVYHFGPRIVKPETRGVFYLLGLVHGHWDMPTDASQDSAFDSERLNMGIAIVVPAQKIMEVINHPRLQEFRAVVEKRDGVGGAAIESEK